MITRKSTWVPILVLTLLILSCRSDNSRRLSRGDQERLAGLAAERLPEEIRLRARQFACGTSPVSLSPDVAVAVTARQCLSCRSVGLLVRGLARRSRVERQNLWVLVPRADTTEVCRFLRTEKVPADVTVMATRNEAFVDPERLGAMIYLKFAPDGSIERVVKHEDGVELLKRTEEPSSSGSEPG